MRTTMPEQVKAPAESGRVGIIQAVDTPLGFFTLVVLIIEGVLGLLIGTTFTGTERTIALYGMLGIIALLIAVVVWLAWFRPEALAGTRHKASVESEVLTAPSLRELSRL